MITMRPTGLSFSVERDGKDYTVSSGEWAMDWGHEIYRASHSPATRRIRPP
jgi:hypothetical protein